MDEDYICEECGEEITVFFDEMDGEEIYDGETGHKQGCSTSWEPII